MFNWLKKLLGRGGESSVQDPAAAITVGSQLLSKGDKAGARRLCDRFLASTISSRNRCDLLQIRAMSHFMEQDIIQYFSAADDFLEAALIVDADLSVRSGCLKCHQSVLYWAVSELQKVTSDSSAPAVTRTTAELIIASAWARQGQYISSGATAINVSRSQAGTKIVKDAAQSLVGIISSKLSAIASTAPLSPLTRAEALFKRAVLRELTGDSSGCTADLQALTADVNVPSSIKESVRRFDKGDGKLLPEWMSQETKTVESSLSIVNGSLSMQVFDHASTQQAPRDAAPFNNLDAFLVWHAIAGIPVPSVADFAPGK